MCELIDLTCGIVSAAISRVITKTSLRDRCVFSANGGGTTLRNYIAYNDNRTIQTSCR